MRSFVCEIAYMSYIIHASMPLQSHKNAYTYARMFATQILEATAGFQLLGIFEHIKHLHCDRAIENLENHLRKACEKSDIGCKTKVSDALRALVNRNKANMNMGGRRATGGEMMLKGSFFEGFELLTSSEESAFTKLDDALGEAIDNYCENELASKFKVLEKQAVDGWLAQKTGSKWPVLGTDKRWGLMFARAPCNNKAINLLDPMFKPLFDERAVFQPLLDKIKTECLIEGFIPAALEDLSNLLRKNYNAGVEAVHINQVIEEFMTVRMSISVCRCKDRHCARVHDELFKPGK
jgi:hypothetical protein